MEYLDFVLEIGPGEGRDYPVAVIHSPSGEARETMNFPFDTLALENRLQALEIALLRSGGKRRRVLSNQEQTVRDFGEQLFNSLISGELRSRYDVSLNRAAEERKGLRIKIRIQSPQLAALPWEFLFDGRQEEYLCLSTKTPVVRYIELPQPVQPLAVRLPLRILGMVASPCDLPSLDIDREKQRIEEAVKGLISEGLVELTWLEGQTWRALQRAMRGGPWHIFHFIGHGGFDTQTDEGVISFTDEKGREHTISATQLSRLLADHYPLRLVLLNSCEGARSGSRDIFSSSASILVQKGIPAVIANQYEVTDRAAIEFARSFYESIADGLPIDASMAEARKAISFAINNTLEWGIPVLYMRSPDGVIFSLTHEPGVKKIKQEAPPPVKAEEEPPPPPQQPPLAEPKPRTKSPKKPISKKKKAKAAGMAPRNEEGEKDAEEMYNKGLMYAGGVGVKQNFEEAASWYLKAAEAGNVRAMNELAGLYLIGQGIEQSEKESTNWNRKAAETGDGEGMCSLGFAYANGWGIRKNSKEAMRWFLKAAEAGNCTAMNQLGEIYTTGTGVKQSTREAVKWYHKSAKAGDETALFILGMKYNEGSGVRKNYKEAVKWYRKAVESGFAWGMNLLGKMYEDGTGVEQDDKEAVKWYRKAAEAGDHEGMCNLGAAYAKGTGVKKNNKQAANWYRKAAEEGNANAMNLLAVLYDSGVGVEQDFKEALKWYRKAAKAGNEDATALLEDLGKTN